MSRPLEGHIVILVLHLLSDVQGFIRTLLHLGLEPDRTLLLNIPYSTKQDTVASLWTAGLRNLFLSAEYPMDAAIVAAVARAAELADLTDAPIVVVEDGGYIGPYLHLQTPHLLDRVKGIVEQTRNGIWQYEEQGIAQPRVPVVSVAESALKNDLESPLIGRAILRNVEDLVGQIGFNLPPRTLLLGYGATGSRAAKHFNDVCDDFRVYDVEDEKRDAARVAGYTVAEELRSECREAELIVGCTGKFPISADILLGFDGKTYFANASSKRRELDWDSLAETSVDAEPLRDGAGTRWTLPNGAVLIALADGYPVNFVGESVPDEEIAFVYGLLLRSLLLVVDGKLEAGFVEVPQEVQEEVRADHFRVLNGEFPPREESL